MVFDRLPFVVLVLGPLGINYQFFTHDRLGVFSGTAGPRFDDLDDFKLKQLSAWSLTVIVPLALFMIGFKNFIETLWFAGSIAAALAGILIVLMHWRCRSRTEKKPAYTIKETISSEQS